MDPSPRLPTPSSDDEPFEGHVLPIAWNQRLVASYIPNSVTATLPDPMENNSPYGPAGMLRFTKDSFSCAVSEALEDQEWLGSKFKEMEPAAQRQLSKFSAQCWTVWSSAFVLKKLGHGN
ncbi:MAG: hypothetical protein ACTHZ7_04655 [Sphingobacterium sp.]